MATPTYTKSGNKATTAAKLDKSVFGALPKSHELLKQAYVAYLSNSRENAAQVKTRGEIRGGGRKPWRQKGTGRARFGSSRNPIWRGGGIVFGPTGNENYTKKLPTSAKRTALRQALSLAAKENQLIVIESFESKDGKLKPTVELLNKIGATGNILLVVEDKSDLVDRATRNLSRLTVVQAKYLNVYDLLNADNVIVTKKALDIVHEWLAPTPKASEHKSGGTK